MSRLKTSLLAVACLLILWCPSQAQDGARKPVTLYGRIEEIAGQTGAKLPIDLRPMTAKMDNSQQSAAPLQGKAQLNTTGAAGYRANLQTNRSQYSDPFPMDWRGIWGGTLKIFRAEFDPICWQFDAEEANKEKEILKPGTNGDVSFHFNQTGNRLELQPTQVYIKVPLSQTRYAESLSQLMGSMGGQNNMLANMAVPYALHLGNLERGTGVTGNTLQARLLKNSVRQLAPGVLEQQVITYNGDTSTTGKVRYSYSESVLRFYRQSSTQLYVQVAMVSYLPDGHFKDKVILVGTVIRGQDTGRAPDLNSLLNGFMQ